MPHDPDLETFNGFLSYAQNDDARNEGRISVLKTRLEDEVRTISGTEFQIFQDRTGIHTGEQIMPKIQRSIQEIVVLIVILTPTFLTRDACLKEVKAFLERERELGCDDLIVPIHYVDTPMLEDSTDNTVIELSKRRYFDWRSLRSKEFNTSQVREALQELAYEVMAAVQRARTASRPYGLLVGEIGTQRLQVFRAANGIYLPNQVRQIREFTVATLTDAVNAVVQWRLGDIGSSNTIHKIKPESPTIPLQNVLFYSHGELIEHWCVQEKVGNVT